jgi:Protein of unknown function (DUF2867)
LPGAQFGDAFRLSLTDATMDAPLAARRMMGRSPGWVRILMRLRNAIVTPLGLRTPGPRAEMPGKAIGPFPVIASSASRMVMGFDDKHLDFRVIMDVAHDGGDCRVTATTLVETHNLLGRTYLAIIKPFHRLIVRTMLEQVCEP